MEPWPRVDTHHTQCDLSDSVSWSRVPAGEPSWRSVPAREPATLRRQGPGPVCPEGDMVTNAKGTRSCKKQGVSPPWGLRGGCSCCAWALDI